jgi:hypothetical protein
MISSGTGKDIGIDCNEQCWVVGMENHIYKCPFGGSSWSLYPGGGQGTALAVSSSGDAYHIGINQHIYKANGTGWTELPGGNGWSTGHRSRWNWTSLGNWTYWSHFLP